MQDVLLTELTPDRVPIEDVTSYDMRKGGAEAGAALHRPFHGRCASEREPASYHRSMDAGDLSEPCISTAVGVCDAAYATGCPSVLYSLHYVELVLVSGSTSERCCECKSACLSVGR